MKEAQKYPTPDTFDRIIGLTNRPLTKKEAFLPDDERLALFGGIDLTQGVEAVAKSLQAIEGISGVTHVYFAGEHLWG